MDTVTLILLIVGFALGGWLVATWYFANNKQLFAHASEARVTFKRVLANAIADARELFDRLTNMTAVALVSLNATVLATPEIKTALLGSTWGLGAFIALNLFTAMSPRIRDRA